LLHEQQRQLQAAAGAMLVAKTHPGAASWLPCTCYSLLLLGKWKICVVKKEKGKILYILDCVIFRKCRALL